MSARVTAPRPDLCAPLDAMRQTPLIAGVALAAFLLTACDASVLEAAPSTVCTEAGTQCQLPTGPLGVCERSLCPAGVSSPCFECISQH